MRSQSRKATAVMVVCRRCTAGKVEVGGSPRTSDRHGSVRNKTSLNLVKQRIEELEERLVEMVAVARGEFNDADAGDDDATDSGNGSGRWKVTERAAA